MLQTTSKPSMNEPHDQDPLNNSSYGTLVDSPYKLVSLPVLDVLDFNERIIRGYEDGSAEKGLPADLSLARSLVPAGTATLRDFSNIAPEIPLYIPENCTGCMDCVTQCPDTAILGKVLSETELEERLATITEPADREMFRTQWSRTKKYFDAPKKKGLPGGMFNIIIDPSKCKGCAECVTMCDDNALKMADKTDEVMTTARKSHRYFKNFGPSNAQYVSDNLLIDMMLKEQTHLYTGGAGSCAGCGEGTALRMMCAATGSKYGDQWGIVAATGCNTVYTSTYPYNPYLVPWTNSLFENAPAYAIGVRMRWNQMGWQDRPLWCLGGDGAMFDIGFQNLSRMMMSGKPVKVVILDTQVYSNTGGQACTSGFTGQVSDMAQYGKAIKGKEEIRKEITLIGMAHRTTYMAQGSSSNPTHLIESFIEGLNARRPAVFTIYSPCMPEHGIGDDSAQHQSKLAVESRAFPLIRYNPDKGTLPEECFDLDGNPSPDTDWPTYTLKYTDDDGKPASMEVPLTFADFAITEGRFRKQFRTVPRDAWNENLIPLAEFLDLSAEDREDKFPYIWALDKKNRLMRVIPAEPLVKSCEDRRSYWRMLKALATKHEAVDVAAIAEQARAEFAQSLAAKLLKMVGEGGELPVNGKTATPEVLPALPAAGAAPPAKAGSDGDSTAPWIESAMCTSCNECININGKIFAYDADKHAFVKDPKGGPYKDLVRAAEKCTAQVIHPGTPWNPKEKDLDKLIKRAAKYN